MKKQFLFLLPFLFFSCDKENNFLPNESHIETRSIEPVEIKWMEEPNGGGNYVCNFKSPINEIPDNDTGIPLWFEVRGKITYNTQNNTFTTSNFTVSCIKCDGLPYNAERFSYQLIINSVKDNILSYTILYEYDCEVPPLRPGSTIPGKMNCGNAKSFTYNIL